MSVEDKKLARQLQRELARHQSLDTSEVIVNVTRNVGYLTGVIRPSLGVFFDQKEETKALMDIGHRLPALRDLVIDVRWEISTKR